MCYANLGRCIGSGTAASLCRLLLPVLQRLLTVRDYVVVDEVRRFVSRVLGMGLARR